MAAATTIPSYWLNWRFPLCAVFLLAIMVISIILIRKYEGSKKRRGIVYEDEAWGTCHKGIHPAWLLAYRVIAFLLLLGLLIGNVALDGYGIFYFYTQWTFTLVTVYFGLASVLSIIGCRKHHQEISGDKVDHVAVDTECGTCIPTSPREKEKSSNMPKVLCTDEKLPTRQVAGKGGYILQIIYQVCAGAVVLTDCVFWLLLYSILLNSNQSLGFMMVSMHSFNAVFLLGETLLNCLRFPLFRIAYFVLWTSIFVIFQWIFHGCVSIGWPYPFMDLSSPFAPLWYLGVGVFHIPSFGIFALMIKLKQFLISRYFPSVIVSDVPK